MVMRRQLIGINAIPMKLQIATPLGEYNIRQPKASMQRDVQKSEMNLDHDPMELHIDYSEVSASLGYNSPTKLRQKVVSESKQTVLKLIGEKCQDGDQMLKTRGDAYVNICHRKFIGDPYNLEQIFMPAPPSITWSGSGTTKVEFTPYRQDIKWDVPLKAETEYQRRKPEVSVAQWHKVDITYNGTPSDVTKIGVESARKLHLEI